MSEDKKKEIDAVFTEKYQDIKLQCEIYSMRVSGHFGTENYTHRLNIVQKILWVLSNLLV